MTANVTNRLIDRCFKERFLFLLIALLSFLLLTPLLQGFFGLSILFEIFLTAILISAIYAISQKKHSSLIGTLLILPLLISTWSSHFVEIPSLSLVGDCFGILFFTFAVITILSFIFRQGKMTLDVIYAAIVVYLLIAVIYALLFSLVESLQPGSFTISLGESQRIRLSFYYYSFVTITTLGYGDITPLSDMARSLALLEAVIGQIYLVVLVARLVGIHIAQSMKEQS